jgi:hypothetical protein
VTLSGCLLTTGAAGIAGVVGAVVPLPVVDTLTLSVDSSLPPHPVNRIGITMADKAMARLIFCFFITKLQLLDLNKVMN